MCYETNWTILNCMRWLLALSAFFVTCISVLESACSLLECSNKSGDDVSSFGLWHYQKGSTNASCQTYPADTTIDGLWKSARVFSITSVIFATIVSTLELYHAYGRKRVVDGLETFTTMYLLLYGYLLTGTVQGLTLLFLLSGVEDSDLAGKSCSISTGGKYAISAASLWFATAILSILSLLNKQIDGEKGEDGKTSSISTEPLLFFKGYDVDDEAKPNPVPGSHPTREKSWKDVVKRISDVGDIDFGDLDSSLHDDEVYASVNATFDEDLYNDTNNNRASRPRPKKKSDWKEVLKRLSDTGEIDIDELDDTDHDEEVYASVNEAAYWDI